MDAFGLVGKEGLKSVHTDAAGPAGRRQVVLPSPACYQPCGTLRPNFGVRQQTTVQGGQSIREVIRLWMAEGGRAAVAAATTDHTGMSADEDIDVSTLLTMPASPRSKRYRLPDILNPQEH